MIFVGKTLSKPTTPLNSPRHFGRRVHDLEYKSLGRKDLLTLPFSKADLAAEVINTFCNAFLASLIALAATGFQSRAALSFA